MYRQKLFKTMMLGLVCLMAGACQSRQNNAGQPSAAALQKDAEVKKQVDQKVHDTVKSFATAGSIDEKLVKVDVLRSDIRKIRAGKIADKVENSIELDILQMALDDIDTKNFDKSKCGEYRAKIYHDYAPSLENEKQAELSDASVKKVIEILKKLCQE